jgi:outer membrane lipoprotein-sorting protein
VPSKPAYEDQILPADRLIKQLEKNRRKIKTFRGTGVMNIVSPELSANANFEVMLKKPDSIRISIYGPFGIDLAHALVTKQSFVFHDVIRNNVYEGRNKENILKQIFKVDFSFDDLMDAFAGAVNLTYNLSREPDKYTINEQDYFLTYTDEEKSKESKYVISIVNLALLNYQLTNMDGSVVFEGKYKDFKLFDEVPVPYKTLVESKEKMQSVDIEYRNIEINKEIKALTIDIPKDANIIKW